MLRGAVTILGALDPVRVVTGGAYTLPRLTLTPWSPGMPGVSHVGWAALLAFGSPVLGNVGRKGSG